MPKIIEYSDELTHYGRLGMKWGQHIFTDSDPKGSIRTGSGKKINSKDSRTLNGKQQKEKKSARVTRKKHVTGNGKDIFLREGLDSYTSLSGRDSYFYGTAYGTIGNQQYADQELLDLLKRIDALDANGDLDEFRRNWSMLFPSTLNFDRVRRSAVVLNEFENFVKTQYKLDPSDKKYGEKVIKILNTPGIPFSANLVSQAYGVRNELAQFISDYNDNTFKKSGG